LGFRVESVGVRVEDRGIMPLANPDLDHFAGRVRGLPELDFCHVYGYGIKVCGSGSCLKFRV